MSLAQGNNTLLFAFIDKLSARDGSRLSNVSNKGNSKILNSNTNKIIFFIFSIEIYNFDNFPNKPVPNLSVSLP